MQQRSWLFVPAASERKLARAASSGADVIIVDLCGSDDQRILGASRQMAAAWLTAHRQQITENRKLGRWVRINPLESRSWRDDLVAVMPGSPDGIMLPQAAGPEAIRQLSAELYELEQVNRLPNGSIRIMPVVGETPESALGMAAYIDVVLPRMAGFAWSPQGLTQTLGATRSRDGQGDWSDSCRFVRAQVLLCAHARGLLAVDAFHDDWNDLKGISLAAGDARADGFTGMLAIHPAQAPVINQAFVPSTEELDRARAIVAAQAGMEDSGLTEFDNRRDAQPGLRQARRLLGLEDGQAATRQTRGAILRPA